MFNDLHGVKLPSAKGRHFQNSNLVTVSISGSKTRDKLK